MGYLLERFERIELEESADFTASISKRGPHEDNPQVVPVLLVTGSGCFAGRPTNGPLFCMELLKTRFYGSVGLKFRYDRLTLTKGMA